jgi:hypothetical protein
MRVRWRLFLGFLAGVPALAACWTQIPDEDDLVRTATVAAIPGLHSEAVVISEIKRAPKRVTWKALTPGGEFDCNANEFLAWPSCEQATHRGLRRTPPARELR